ncbi:unnamed protein product [Haemonchus placei]|uniref:Zinc metalloproteinase n=1 Tax=Haemonchus placei TaxID=6290 RepID=A0A0N4VVL3_HAEPC|nr:unnamed protein product [Haemonchus placei]
MDSTCVDFKENKSDQRMIHLNSRGLAEDRIGVFMENGCWSSVGKRGGLQKLSLGRGCEHVRIAAHEIGHALGFFHTHSRHDRDDYITVDIENIEPGETSQFKTKSKTDNNNYGIPYDYGSVMHYEATRYSIYLACTAYIINTGLVNELEVFSFAVDDERPTLVPKDLNYTETLGSPFISFYDILMMNIQYNCLDRCEGINTQCRNGGFAHPRACYKCVCPHGYGGKLCGRRVNVFFSLNSQIFRKIFQPKGCGERLKASEDWTTLVDDLGDKEAGHVYREDFVKCHYWITVLKFVDFTKGADTDGCQLAGVEIKTKKDPGLTGYSRLETLIIKTILTYNLCSRFCSDKFANTTLTSTRNVVPIITYNRYSYTKTKLEYRYI